MLNARALAAQIITDVTMQGCSLKDAFAHYLPNESENRDIGFIKELCYGSLRHYFRLSAFLKILLQKPLKEKDEDIYNLLIVGLYQLTAMRVPPHAAIAETVNAARDLKKEWATGFTNGVLRNFQRQEKNLNEKISRDPVAQSMHPEWLLNALKNAWSSEWSTIIEANNSHPPFNLRVNLKHNTREEYLDRLAKEKIGANVNTQNTAGICLDSPQPVQSLPGFLEGDVSVQDAAAQLAAELLELAPGLRVLDACAAPGGKTAHILETENNLSELVALEVDKTRLQKILETLSRLQLYPSTNTNIQIVCADATQALQWREPYFDRILIDAPCSATGVIRRHPDIKLLRQASDIAALAQQQTNLLESLWPLLKPGGLLVYATCSVLPEENEHVMQAFLEKHSNAKEKVINASWGKAVSIGRQIFPEINGMDGFYYARLEKCE
jgi:16S rRNA (cytosine967-C5)-methyltransferase